MNLKKLLSAIGLLAVAAPVALNVVACDSNTKVTEIALETIIINTEGNGNNVTDETSLVAELARINEYPDLTIDIVDVKEFNPPALDQTGSAIIVAKEESKFTGSVAVTITEKKTLEKIFENLRNAPRESEEKFHAWNDYFDYKFNQIKDAVAEGKITAELDNEINYYFYLWVGKFLKENAHEELISEGIDIDYNRFDFVLTPPFPNWDTEKHTIIFSGLAMASYWGSLTGYVYKIVDWKINYKIKG